MPVINENDTVATSEIRYGDNDRLAARVATMIGRRSAGAALRHRRALHRAAGSATRRRGTSRWSRASPPRSRRWPAAPASELSRGGMRTKIEAAQDRDGRRHATWSSPTARVEEPARGASPRAARCTWFLTALQPGDRAQELDRRRARAARRAASSMPARRARCARGKSLLPAGVTPRRGRVRARRCGGDPRSGRREIGRGLVAYDARRCGADRRPHESREIEAILGYRGRDEMIHRDDMALAAEPGCRRSRQRI